MSSYVPITFTDGTTPLNKATMDTLQNGLIAAQAAIGLTKLWDSTEAGVVFPAATITTPALPQTFKHLRIELHCRSDVNVGYDRFLMRFNGDTGPNYDHAFHGATYAGQSGMACSYMVGASGSTAQEVGTALLLVANYTGTTNRKHVVGVSSLFEVDGNVNTMATNPLGGKWRNTAPVTSLSFIAGGGGNTVAPTRITIYGES